MIMYLVCSALHRFYVGMVITCIVSIHSGSALKMVDFTWLLSRVKC